MVASFISQVRRTKADIQEGEELAEIGEGPGEEEKAELLERLKVSKTQLDAAVVKIRECTNKLRQLAAEMPELSEHPVMTLSSHSS